MHPELFTIPGLGWPIRSYGAFVVLAFLAAIWWTTSRAKRVNADQDIILNIGFIALIFGWVGARIFHAIHYWDSVYAKDPMSVFSIQRGGFEVYGGLITAALVSLAYLMMKKLSVRVYADIVMPSLLLGMGIGRIGCFLHGCCWGGPCPDQLPWAVRFPYGSPPHMRQWQDLQATLPAELMIIGPIGNPTPYLPEQLAKYEAQYAKGMARAEELRSSNDPEVQKQLARGEAGLELLNEAIIQPLKQHPERFAKTPETIAQMTQHADHHSTSVHPAQLYGAIGPILLAIMLHLYFNRRERDGTVFALALMLYSVERFLEELIRMDNPHDTFGLTVSQGVSIAIFAIGLLTWFALKRMPLKSPVPVAYDCAPKPDADTSQAQETNVE